MTPLQLTAVIAAAVTPMIIGGIIELVRYIEFRRKEREDRARRREIALNDDLYAKLPYRR